MASLMYVKPSELASNLSCYYVTCYMCMHMCMHMYPVRCTCGVPRLCQKQRRPVIKAAEPHWPHPQLCTAGREAAELPAGGQKAAELAALTPSLCSEPLAALVALARSVLSAVLYESSARKPGVWQTPPLSRVFAHL